MAATGELCRDYGLSIVSFSNLTYAPMSVVNTQVLDTLIKVAKLRPRELTTSAILDQRKSERIKLLPDWKTPETSHIFAENFFLDYFTDDLRKEAGKIFKEAGKIIRIGEFTPLNNLRGFFRVEGEKKDIIIGFTLTPENPPLIQEHHIDSAEKGK